jgi:pimeloyl-ACP methyl ester carboxylesterase
LLLAGEFDPIVTSRDVEDLAAAFPPDRVELVRFPNAGHGLIGHHAAVLERVREFVLRDTRA